MWLTANQAPRLDKERKRLETYSAVIAYSAQSIKILIEVYICKVSSWVINARQRESKW